MIQSTRFVSPSQNFLLSCKQTVELRKMGGDYEGNPFSIKIQRLKVFVKLHPKLTIMNMRKYACIKKHLHTNTRCTLTVRLPTCTLLHVHTDTVHMTVAPTLEATLLNTALQNINACYDYITLLVLQKLYRQYGTFSD